MAFQQYPDSIAAIISSGAPYTIDLGGVTPDEDEQLEYYRVQIFKRGLQPDVKLSVKAYVSNVLEAESEQISVSSIENEYSATDNFYGWLAFKFSPRFNLNASGETRFELVLTDYTFTENAIFVGVVLDWPVTMGFNDTPGPASDAPVALELYGAI